VLQHMCLGFTVRDVGCYVGGLSELFHKCVADAWKMFHLKLDSIDWDGKMVTKSR